MMCVGTVISNSILLSLFRSKLQNSMFVSLRILEDRWYQANVRQTLVNYVNTITSAYGNRFTLLCCVTPPSITHSVLS